ncbi:MAG: sigma-70 family RNA polymerase sigma factor [Planctomycetes bacterium]|nr:sigma-70 family RNA polymerase sigma factor [Planctomycetota bacterium]
MVERRHEPAADVTADAAIDRALVTRARAGDRVAFDELVERHGRAVLGYLRRLAPRPGDAEDLFQETFLRAWRALASLADPERLRAWLLTIATNVVRRGFGKPRSGSLDEFDDGSPHEPAADDPTAIDHIDVGERAHAVRAAIDRLPTRQRAVVALRVDLELPFIEIARVLGIREDNARAHHYQAMKALERMLRPVLAAKSVEERR